MDDKYVKEGYLYDDFRMFHLKDKSDRKYEFHYHDFYKILVFISGNVTYSIEGKSYKLKPYDVVLVSSGTIHKPEVSLHEPYERIVFYISKDYLERHKSETYDLADVFERASMEKSDLLRFPPMVNSVLLETIKKLEENGKNELYASELYAKSLFLEFMILLNRACRDEKNCFSHSISYNQKMIDLITYINEHLKEDLSIDELAEKFYISKYHMMRQFKEETGYTIHKYITEKRVIEAKNLIMAGMPATKACFECGFKEYSTFSRAFKTRVDKKPSEI